MTLPLCQAVGSKPTNTAFLSSYDYLQKKHKKSWHPTIAHSNPSVAAMIVARLGQLYSRASSPNEPEPL